MDMAANAVPVYVSGRGERKKLSFYFYYFVLYLGMWPLTRHISLSYIADLATFNCLWFEVLPQLYSFNPFSCFIFETITWSKKGGDVESRSKIW